MHCKSDFFGRRLTRHERFDWRFVLALAGSVLLLMAYFLPLVPERITAATTRFSGGTVIELEFPVLVTGQHFAQAHHPLREELESVKISVAPVEQHGGSGWSWLFSLFASWPRLWSLLSYALTLLLPVLSALLCLTFVLVTYTSPRGLAEYLIPWAFKGALLAPFALGLAWLQQCDFSMRLLALAPKALTPAIGFWVALGALLLNLVALWRLTRETERTLFSWWALVFAVGLALWLLIRLRPQPFLDIWRFVSDGILITLRIVLTSFVFIVLVSLLGGLGRISHSRIIYGISSLYVELIRGIPLLVQLLFIWFALPQVLDAVGEFVLRAFPPLQREGQWLIDLRLSPFTAAVTGLTICYGAYGSEIFRAGISSIHHGQMEAARSLGMNYIQAMRYVILPQAIRVILPPIGNEFVALLKDSSLVSVLAVSDLTRRGREYMSRTFLSFDTWILVALCYLVMTLFSSRAVEFIESKTKF